MNQKVMEEAIGRALDLSIQQPRVHESRTVEALRFALNIPQQDDAEEEERQSDRAIRAASYLEKLCQNVWRLPSVADPKQLLLGWIDDDKLKQRFDAAIGHASCLPPNPRRLKGYANLLQRLASRLDHADDPAEDIAIREARMLMVVAYAYQFHNDLFVRWEHDPALFDHIVNWSRGQDVDVPVFRQLDRAWAITEGGGSPLSYLVESRFPDPTDSQVFWVQELVHEAALAGAEPGDFVRYLRDIR